MRPDDELNIGQRGCTSCEAAISCRSASWVSTTNDEVDGHRLSGRMSSPRCRSLAAQRGVELVQGGFDQLGGRQRGLML